MKFGCVTDILVVFSTNFGGFQRKFIDRLWVFDYTYCDYECVIRRHEFTGRYL